MHVFDENGVSISLGPEFGRGGEGTVYDIVGQPKSAAKVYQKPRTPADQAKLAVMPALATPSLLNVAAWPTRTLRSSRTGPVVGFVMPKFSGLSPVFKLYSPKLRLQEFQKADWRFLIHAAANATRAFSTVHAAGFVVGDVNHGNLLIGQDATVRLIDCDSFQVTKDRKTWFCEVGVGTHQPPEMQALSDYAGVHRTPNHDNFGLAIIIFQLLCIAKHPFSGYYPDKDDHPSIEEAIAKNRYAYSRDQQRTRSFPPAGSLPVDALSPEVRDLFEAAFSPTASRGGRPTPDQWGAALQRLGSSLRACTLNAAHYFLKGLAQCPWCQIEAASGIPLFPVVFVTPIGSSTGIAALWQEVTRTSPPPPLRELPDPAGTIVVPSQAALAVARRGHQLRISAYTAVAVSTLLLIMAASSDARVWLLIALAVIIGVVFKKTDIKTSETGRLASVKNDWHALETAWIAPPTKPDFVEIRHSLDLIKAEHDSLVDRRVKRLQQLSENIKQKQLLEHLDRFNIASAQIPGIRTAKVATLANHGIDTAADIEYARLITIAGFGSVTTQKLLAWRRICERSFTFDPRRGISQSDAAAVERDIAATRVALERDMAAGVARLKGVAASAALRQSVLEKRAAELLPRYAQATADARAVPGDMVRSWRLMGLSGATFALTLILFSSTQAPRAQSTATTAAVIHPAIPPVGHAPKASLAQPATPVPPHRVQSAAINLSPTAPIQASSDERAKSLVTSYFASWSGSGANVESLAQYYGATAFYYGTAEAREKIMEEKRKFSIRWPIRSYAVRPGTLTTQCTDTCSVSGTVEWDVSSPSRSAHSIGSASFDFRIALNGSAAGGILLSENGAVIAAHNDALPAAQASPTTATVDPGLLSPGYAAGRQARLDYEAWFNGLPAGEYRSGAEFWAENRSLKVPPSCIQPEKPTVWQSGCVANKVKLRTSDARRRVDNDFRAGWNSL